MYPLRKVLQNCFSINDDFTHAAENEIRLWKANAQCPRRVGSLFTHTITAKRKELCIFRRHQCGGRAGRHFFSAVSVQTVLIGVTRIGKLSETTANGDIQFTEIL